MTLTFLSNNLLGTFEIDRLVISVYGNPAKMENWRIVVRVSKYEYFTLPFLSHERVEDGRTRELALDVVTAARLARELPRDRVEIQYLPTYEEPVRLMLELLGSMTPPVNIGQMYEIARDLFARKVIKVWRAVWKPSDAELVIEFTQHVYYDRLVKRLGDVMRLVEKLRVGDERYRELIGMWCSYINWIRDVWNSLLTIL